MRLWEGCAPSGSNKLIYIFAFSLAGFVISLALLGPLRNSKIALVDENDIPLYMGTVGKVEFNQIPKIWMEKTEIGTYAESSRMRPTYYFIRVIETALWGSEGRYWYTWRIVMFGVVIAAMAWIYMRLTGVLAGATLTAYTLSFGMWADIWARSTGPSEQYASLGCAAFAVGAVILLDQWKNGGLLRAPIVLISLGAIVAMGTKENLLPLEVPLALLLLASWAKRRLDTVGALFLVAALAMGLWVASSIAVYLLRTKVQDMYGSELHAGILVSRLMIMIYIFVVISVFVIAAVDRIIGNRFGRDKQLASRSIAKRFTMTATIILLALVSQQIFYSGRLPSRSRYDFPGLLAVPALIVLMLRSLQRTGELLLPGRPFHKIMATTASGVLAIYCCLVTWRLPSAVAANVQRTTAFDEAFTKTRLAAAVHPDWPIVIRSYDPWDYEIVQSLGILFIARGIENPRFLVHTVNAGAPRTAFESDVLDRDLQSQSRDGLADRGYRPLGEFEQSARAGCYVIALRLIEVFDTERKVTSANGAGLNCQRLPMHIYWDHGNLVFLPG